MIIKYIYSLKVFHISVNWWSFTEAWMTVSLHKSTGLFSLNILADLNDAVVYTVSTPLVIS